MFGELKILRAPLDWIFEFQILDGRLRIFNTHELGLPWEIGVESVPRGGAIILKTISVKGIQSPVLRIQSDPDNDDLKLVIAHFIPDENLVWTVSWEEFNRLFRETQGINPYTAKYLSAGEITSGRLWIDEGFE